MITHLAAVIPPVIYRDPTLGRRVNIDARRRPGDPDSDENWFVTDWMDTRRAQQALGFQRHPWPDMLAEMRAGVGWRRYPMGLLAPVARLFLKSRAAYHNMPGPYADPWGAIAALGEPAPDRQPVA